MPNPPRRPFFQIHLSTAIVLMFTAGARITPLLATTFRWWLATIKNTLSRLQPA
ncbi:MAG: hypothetical protein WCT04_17625 [Planctomycetota bacterium]